MRRGCVDCGQGCVGGSGMWEGARTWQGAVKGSGSGIYRVVATHHCAWGHMGCRGEGVGGVWDVWIAVVVGWLHSQPVRGNDQCKEG